MSGTKFVHVFSSPSRRAQRTCALVGLGKDAEIEADLAEWNYGDYEGGCTADIRKGRRTGISSVTGVPGVKCPVKFPTAPTDS